MRLPRFRFTTRKMMVGTAVVALLLLATTRLLKPYPTVGSFNGDFQVGWSDGSATSYARMDHYPVARVDHLGPIARVKWKDGSTTIHLRYTPKKRREPKPLDVPLGIPPIQNGTF
jgi:hypothetical protein